MHNIAITGSFASGKSFILNCLSSMGYKIFSCDEYIKKLYENISIQELVENTIEGLGKFNKQNLAKIIYEKKESRQQLEKIIHPKVRFAIKEFEENNQEEDFIFTEVPLLFEFGFNEYFSYNICVFCSEKPEFQGLMLEALLTQKYLKKLNKYSFLKMKRKTEQILLLIANKKKKK